MEIPQVTSTEFHVAMSGARGGAICEGLGKLVVDEAGSG